MTTPPLLLGATLLFWGWASGLLWLGALAALAVEAPRFAHNRLHFAQADLDRIWNLCSVLFFGAFVVAFVNADGATALTIVMDNNSFANRIEALNKGGRSVILVLLWLPVIFLPMAVAQAFSDEERMDWSTFSPWLRRQRGRDGERWFAGGVNIGWPYFAMCLLAASAGNERSMWFPIGVAVLTTWGLWPAGGRGARRAAWCVCLAAALFAGFAAQAGMREMQALMQRLESSLIARFASGRGFEPKEHRTSLGSIGRLKLSGEIILRVEATNQPPELLREASYKLFFSQSWVAPKQDFKDVLPEVDLTTWRLLPDKVRRKEITVSGFLGGGQGLIPAPMGVAKLQELLAGTVETNRLGAIKVTEGPGFYRLTASYDVGRSIDSVPDTMDQDIPAYELPAITNTVETLALRGQSPASIVGKLKEFFEREFRYTTWQEEPRRRRTNDTPLQRFLTTDRAGHCEHFATATVLLLRAAGVPARYAVGYSVQEKRGEQWIVRERHGHAWCLAWMDGAWRDVDLTPANWAATESQRADAWERFKDRWSDFWFAFSQWRWGKGEWKQYLIWLVVPLILIASWRLMSRKQWNRSGMGISREDHPQIPGSDSEFYLIEQALAKRGLERLPGETPAAWVKRVAGVEPELAGALPALLTTHYRLRFDPRGLEDGDRAALRSAVHHWLKQSVTRLDAPARNSAPNPRQA